ncbi:MAG: MBG domain-containing protein, partial [Firmicutes bacterium]|nr:MBG domain-containing protein [Bacillota bacterium]
MARSRSRPWMKLMSFVLALALTSSMTAGLGGLSALADNGVPYVDEYGQPHTTNNVNITRLGNGGIFVATLETGWYVVDGRVDFPGLTVSGDVNLILADGCDMMVHGDPGNAAINVPSGASLTIWSQSGGTGRLTLFTQPVQAGTVNSMLHLPADWAYPDPNVILIGAGIGGGFYSINGKYNQPGCGTISIHGGIITGVANMALYPDGMYVPAPANFIGPAVFSYQDGHMEWPYEGTVDISGGTISAVPGVIYAKTAYITGGSADVYSFAKVTNKSGTTLHSVAVNGLPANKKVDSIKVSGTNFYGSNAVWTDSAGYLYLWIRNIGSDVIVATNAVLPAAADADLPAAAAADLPAALDASVSADGNVVISADAAAVLAADAVLPAAADVNLPAAADVNLPAAADADLPADLDASVSADGDVVISADAADALAADAVLPAAADAVLPTAGDTPVSVITMTIGGVDYVASVADGGAAAAAESQGGAPSGAPYVDANQQPQYADSVKELTGSETTLTTGWYIANGTLDFGDLVVSGDVNLILADGCSMTATGVPGTAAINVGAGNSLTIWSQAGGTGSLTVSVTPILAGTVNSTLNLPPDQAYPDPNQVLIGAGIGGGFYSVNAIQQAQSCGTVTVNGGVINGRQDMFILSDLLPIAPASTHPPAVSTFFIGPAATAGLDGSYFNYPADGTAIFCGGTLNVGVVNAKTVFVTGGSVNTIMASVAMNNTTLNPWPGQTAVSRPVSYVSIYGLPASARVSGITVNGAVYGSNAVWTSPYGWIYLWLPPASSDVVVATDAVLPSAADAVLPAAADAPVSVITVTIDGVDYVATVGDGGAEAAAQPKSGGAPYVDADKQPQNADNATPLTGGETTLTTGWYIANGKLDYGQLTVSGDVNLILADGCEMTATSTDSYIAAIGVSDGNSLTIWSQSGGTGKLTASVPIISDAHIPYYPTAAIGGRPCGTIVVNGGVLTATGGFGGGMNTGYLTQAGNIISYFLTYNHTGNIEINGGTVVSTVFSANAITITGGTISRLLTDLIGNYPIILLSSTTGVTDGSGTQLRQVTVSGLPANSAVSSITVDGAVYGSNAVWTDADGKLYLWLPPSPAPIVTTSGLMNRALPPTASTLIITIDGADYTVALTGAGDETVSVQQQGGTPYVDADKQPQYADNVTELNGSETTLTTGWYIANGTLDYGSLVVSGDVNLILADGCDMTATSPNYDIAAIGVSDGNSLTVWSQAGGTGKLTANVPAVSLSANPSYLAAAIGGGSCGTVVINGGVLATVNGIGGGRNVTTMWGSDFVAHSIKYNFSGNVVINGGTVVSMIMAAGVTVTGGSMNGLPYDLFNPSAQVSVTDGSGIQLRRVTVSGLPANAAVSSITVDGAAYGSNAVWTDADGMLYLWLPPSPADVIVSASAIQPAAIQPAAGKAGLLRMPPTASTVIITIDGVDYTVTLTGSGDETVTAQPPGGVPYVDANKQPHYAGSVTALDGSETTLTTGWYIAEGTLDYGSLVVSGDVNLILADGCVMTVTSPDVNTAAINVSPGNSLTIWSQAGGTGSLAARANLGAGIGGDGGPSVGDCGTVTINGGVVSAISSVFIGKGNGVSDPSACAIEINGGTLHGPSIHAGTVCVSGGTLEVSAFHPAVGVVTDITGNELRSVRVNGLPAKAAVSYISTDVSAYGTNAVWTNAGGSLFLWLPQSAAAAVITIDGADYSVTLKGSGDETVTAQQGGGGPVGAPYVDANKQAQYADSVTELTGGETTLTTGWYIANGTLDFGNLVISGDVNLILADGCDMTATGTDPSAGITVNPGNSLTVWSQAGGTGRLTAKSLMANGTMGNGAGIGSDCNYAYAGVGAGTIIINGGIITATECYPMSGLGGGGGNAKIGAVEINGGTVNASGINGDNVVITGGSVLVHYYQYQTSAKDASGRPLSMIRVSGLPAGAAVSAVSSAGDAYDWETYGTNAMWTTDASTPFSTGGELYLWLPSDVYVIAITIDGLAHMLFRPSNWAADSQPAGEVPYSDANRQQQHASNVTRLDGSETALTTGWYVADGTLVYKNSLVISGDVNLILADGCDMTVMSTGDAAAINVSPGNSLTIWSQSEGTGKLTADPLTQTGSMSYGAGIGGDGNMSGPAGGLGTLVINGGIVYAVHNIGPGSSSSGGNFSGSMVRINGGTVYAISIDSETVVTGGSVMLSMYNPKNASGNPLIGVNVGGLPAGAAVSDIKVDGAAYGSNGVWTDDNNFIQNSRGNLLIYIPPDASSISVTVGGVVYDYYMVRFTTDGHLSYSPSGAVLAGGDRVFTLTPFPGYKLASLTDDGIDVTDRVVDGTYTIQNLSGPHTLAATTEALPPPDGSHFSFAPKSAVYNGGPQGVTVSCDLSGIGDISVRYNNSRTIPTDPGTYEITVSTSANAEYGALINYDLGAYTILPLQAALEGSVAVTGTPIAGYAITADTSGITSADPGELSYQWFIDGAPVSGATDRAYAPAAADVGKALTVTVTAANYSGSLTSAPVTVAAAGGGATYVDAHKWPMYASDVTQLDGSETTLTTGWYIASGALDFGNIIISGDVKLILADGCDMTVTGTDPSAGITVDPGNSLTVWSQAGGTGRLTAKSLMANGTMGNGAGIGSDCNYGYAGVGAGTIVINGGVINVNDCYSLGSGGGNAAVGTVEINAGTVGARSILGDNVVITGGSVYVRNYLYQMSAKDASGRPVSMIRVSGLPAGAPVSVVSADTALASAYGTSAMWTTDASSFSTGGELFLWLPTDVSVITIKINGVDYIVSRINNWAANPQPAGYVFYNDANRQQQYASDVKVLDGSETALTAGWYVAYGTLVYKNSLVVSGDVNLILADGCDMTVMSAGDAAAIGVSPGNSLTLWSQSEGTGKLTADTGTQTGGYGIGAGIGGDGNKSGPGSPCGTVVINGGIVYAGSHGIGSGGGTAATYGSGALRINGGTLFSITNNCGSVVVTGGNVMSLEHGAKDASGNPVDGVYVGGLPAGAAVSAITVDGAAYGSNGVWTDDNNYILNSRGNLRIFIPAGTSSISVTVGGRVYVYYMVTVTSDGSVSISPSGAVLAGERVFTIDPYPGYKLTSLTDNGTDVTGQVADGTYTIPNLSGPHAFTATTEALPPPDASHFSFTPQSAVYNGGPQGVTVSSDLSGIGVIYVYYNNSMTVPTDPGTYEITIYVNPGSEYGAGRNLDLGAYTILPDGHAALEGAVAILGTPRAGNTLTADTSGITSPVPGALAYQWFINGAP